MTAVFTKSEVIISKDSETVLAGVRHPSTGLWTLPITSSPTASANSVYDLTRIKDQIMFMHQCAFSPVTTTWINAISLGFFKSWPGLSADRVRRHLPKLIATSKGHLRQEYQHQRTTKPSVPTSTEPSSTTAEAFLQVFEPTGKVYSDQTGRFPITSSKGSKYILILYDYDSNAILSRPLKSRAESELVKACNSLYDQLAAAGHSPCFHILDNEAPKGLKATILSRGAKFQLVPPYVHRRNAAERAIGTFKEHFIAGLTTTDPSFPLHLWCRLLPQCDITLNLLRQSRVNPLQSAQAQLFGNFDFNATPLAPPGTKVLIHEKPNHRPTWAPHGSKGWYLGPALEHY